MKRGISRRSVLKGACVLAGTALVPVGYSTFGRNDSGLGVTGSSWILATNQVHRDAKEFISRVASAINVAPTRLVSTSHAAQCGGNVRQDLTLVRNGLIHDLLVDGEVYPEMQAMMTSLRDRKDVATHFVHVYEADNAPDTASSQHVEFIVDGRVVERVTASRNYQDISIEGRAGTTHFRLEDNALSVTKASCQHQTCKRINAKSAGSIVCVPNRLVARLPLMRTVDAITA